VKFAMNRIIANDPLKAQLEGLVVPVEVVDEAGRPLGHFVPRQEVQTTDECPYSDEELRRMRTEQTGRPLPEIWKSLGTK